MFNLPSEILSIYQRSGFDNVISKRIADEVKKRIEQLTNLQNKKDDDDEVDEILKKLNII